MEVFILLIIIMLIIWANKKRKNKRFQYGNLSNKKIYVNNGDHTNKEDITDKQNDNIIIPENKSDDEDIRYLTQEELEKMALKNIDDKWSLFYKVNPNLFDIMFEWIPKDEYRKILRFKQFRTKDTNHAPYITSYNTVDSFFYNGSSPLNIKTTFYGHVQIKYPCKKCVVKMLVPVYDEFRKRYQKQVEDFTDILEIDYSPDTIQEQEQLIYEENERRKKEQERKEIEEIKERLLKKKRREDLEKLALRELMDEGVLFPEAGKRPPIPKEVVDAVWKRDGGKCVYCGSTENLQLDHIIPFSKGGATTVENLQLLCQKCNLQKSNKIG